MGAGPRVRICCCSSHGKVLVKVLALFRRAQGKQPGRTGCTEFRREPKLLLVRSFDFLSGVRSSMV
jgi:hypothetical protein